MIDSAQTYNWQKGIHITFEPQSESPSELKPRFSKICNELSECESLPPECRITDQEYSLEILITDDSLSIRHFKVYNPGNGIGSHLLEELISLGRAHSLSVLSIWIGASDGATKKFLEDHDFTYSVIDDPAHGKTFEGEVIL